MSKCSTCSSQRTLFDYCVKRKKQDSDDGTSVNLSAPPSQQGNLVTVQNPDEGTTIIINAFAGISKPCTVERDAAFCFPCRHFSTGSGRAENTFTKERFRDWKHATSREGILHRHASCFPHNQAMSSW